MKLSLAVGLSVLAVVGRALAGTIIPLDEYDKLWALCKDGGPNVYVGVLYEGNNLKTFSYNQCYPYAINKQNAVMAVFCRPATCYNNPNPDCTGGAVPPVPVPILAGLTLINAAQWVQLLGQGATCQPNGLPNPLS